MTAIAAGCYHSLAIKDGNVYAWGHDPFGALGNGDDLGDSNVPVLVLDLEVDLIDVAAGEFSSYALAADGSLWVWGWNVEGQLGLGYTETPAKVLGQCKCVYYRGVTTPQKLEPPAGYRFTAIDSSGRHVLATIAPIQ